jgi:hypothetical protein
MNLAALRAFVGEARELRSALEEGPRDEAAATIAVSGMLAEQLARELGRDAAPGAVRVAEGRALSSGDLAVHAFAGEPSEDDRALVTSANRLEVPVVLVQLWPQEDWTPPYVLSPFVVECRPGEGFPIDDIAARIVDAVGTGSALSERVPVLRDQLERRVVRDSVVRAGVVGALGGRGRAARPLITLEQARLVARLRPVGDDDAVPGGPQALVAGSVAALEAWGLLFRGLARRSRGIVPTRVADAAIAAGATLALAALAKTARATLATRNE